MKKSDFHDFYECWCCDRDVTPQKTAGTFWKNITPFILEWEQLPPIGKSKIRLPPHFEDKIPYLCDI